MTLATHAVVGAATATLFPSHPITAFFAGFFSHFLLDAIPHWDYKIFSCYANPNTFKSSNQIKPDKLFWLDIFRISCDALLGVLIVIVFLQPQGRMQCLTIGLGAFGAILPDFLQFVYMRFPYQPLVALQKFHVSLMHAKSDLNHRSFIGITSQIAVMICAIVLVKYLVGF